MVFEREVAKIVKAFGIILCLGCCFFFHYPQILSLTDFLSSNIVTYLWQQLLIQLISRDVTYHSEEERFQNAKMNLKVKKNKTCLYFIVWPGLSFPNTQIKLGSRHMLIADMQFKQKSFIVCKSSVSYHAESRTFFIIDIE